ncbi:MAG: hypothetical protein WA767_15595, partial [Pseudolabrys sp.]
MLAMAEVRALRGWQAGLVEAALLGQALQTCKPATYASTAFTSTSSGRKIRPIVMQRSLQARDLLAACVP